jgi:hypothetical protein
MLPIKYPYPFYYPEHSTPGILCAHPGYWYIIDTGTRYLGGSIHQCCGSETIFFGSGSLFQSFGSGSRFGSSLTNKKLWIQFRI